MTLTPTTTNTSAADRAALLQIRLTEFEQLKAEQRARIERRDHLVYATLAVIVAAVAAAVKTPFALLLLAPVTLILGWTHLANDIKITAAGAYLRGPLCRHLEDLTGFAFDVLGWEQAHRDDPRREQRKTIQLFVDWATFVGPAAAGLIGYIALGDPTLPGWAAAVALSLAAGVLASQQMSYADAGQDSVRLRDLWRAAIRARARRRARRASTRP